MQAPIRTVTPDGAIDIRALQRNSHAIGSLFALDSPDGFSFDQGSAGTSLVDQRPKRRLAIVQNVFGSGSGAGSTGGGVGRSGRQIAADMLNAYTVKFAQWVVENDTYVARELPAQPEVLALEANGVVDVPDGAIVEVLPGPGQPDFYYFWWTGEDGSGSNNDEVLTINCGDGTSATYTIARTDDGYSATLVE